MLIKNLINSLQHLTTYFLIAALGIGLIGCSTDGSTNVDEGDPSTNDSSVTAINAVASNDIDGNSTITELVVSGANGETQSVITFKLVGENNLPVSGATVAFALTTNSSEPLENRAKINTTSGVSNSEGLVTVTVNSGIVGEVVSVAAISGEVSTASGSITINLINDTTATAISVVDTNGSPAVTQLVVGGEPGETQSIITFKLVGENNLPVNGADVTFTLATNTSQEASATINKALGISNADGLVSVTINSGTAGEVVSITAISGAASTVSAPITIIDSSVKTITAEVSEAVLFVAGVAGATESLVTFTLKDEGGNPVSGKFVAFTLNSDFAGTPDNNSTLSSEDGNSDENGLVTLTLTSGAVGETASVTATSGDVSTTTEPITINLINDVAVTAINIVDINGSPAEPELVVNGANGLTQSIITFELVGDNGLPVSGATVAFSLATDTLAPPSATINTLTGTSNSQGLATVTVTSGSAEEVVSVTAASGIISRVSSSITIIDPVVTAITFGDASLSNLVLSTSTGETGATQSIVKFVLLGEKDQPIAGKTVTFVLNNALGGAALTNPSDVSDAEGRVSTTVESGTVPTIVNVTATIGDLTADSNDISISTGAAVPSQFTLLTTRFNQGPPEVWVVDVIVSDQAGNPVADGTQVSFQAESGVVTAACVIGVDFFQSTTTEAGRCNVSWTNGNPPSDGRIEIFATMSGDEDFSDTNGNYSYDPVIDRLIEPYDAEATETFTDSNNNEYWDEDELYADNNPSNGDFDVTFTDWNGNGVWDSSDLGEPFLDSNENGTFDLGEYFKDTNEDGIRQESGDSLWTPDIFISKSITIDLNAP